MDRLDQILEQITDEKRKTGGIHTPEIDSLYDDFIREMEERIERSSIKISPEENVENLLHLICKFRKALTKKPQFNGESRALAAMESNLRLLAMTAPKSKRVTQIETALYSLVESKPELRKLYDDVIESVVLESCSAKLRSLKELSLERSLSEEELNQMQAMKDQIAKSQCALKVYAPES